MKIRYSLIQHIGEDGLLCIFIGCEQFGKIFEVDTSVRVFSDEWSNEDAMVLPTNPNYKKLNAENGAYPPTQNA